MIMKAILLLILIMLMIDITIPKSIEEYNQNRPLVITATSDISPRGAIPKDIDNWRSFVEEKETGNIPLRRQVNNSCASISIAMIADYNNQTYRTQEFYDNCTHRDVINDDGTTLTNIIWCLSSLQFKYRIVEDYPLEYLQTGDIVIYYPDERRNSTHASVIDYNYNNTLRIANPWNRYDIYTYEEFENINTEYSIVITDYSYLRKS